HSTAITLLDGVLKKRIILVIYDFMVYELSFIVSWLQRYTKSAGGERKRGIKRHGFLIFLPKLSENFRYAFFQALLSGTDYTDFTDRAKKKL
ncbi:MAG: hypothetical protein K2I11_04475, partial [Bacteroides sp.]|nr:hypothetical protein [Bacteroides sp.]